MFKLSRTVISLCLIILLLGLIAGIVIASFIFTGGSKSNSKSALNVLDFTPLYTDMPIMGMKNTKGQNVVIFLSKSQFEKVDISILKEIYDGNDAITFAFDDGSALVYVKKDNTMHFANYDKSSMEINIK